MRNAVLALCCVLAACADPPKTGPVAVKDAGTAADACKSTAAATPDAGGKKPGFGERCDPGVGCATGLDCQDSEFAAHPWCTRACSKPNDACDDDKSLGGRKGFCIQMPAGWRGPKAPFCAVQCFSKFSDSECTGLSDDWEHCEQPEYKKLPFHPELQTKVCGAPSQHGLPHVDPATCDWDDKFTDPKYGEAKAVGKDYCLFLKTCQVREACESDACCTWHVFQYVTQFGVNAPQSNSRIADLKCYGQSFTSHQDTPQICSAWLDDCKPIAVK